MHYLHQYKGRVLAGSALAALFVLYILYSIDLNELKKDLSKFEPWVIAPVFLLLLAFFWLKSYRWTLLMSPLSSHTVRQLFPIIMTGVTVGVGISTVVGELVRTYLLGVKYSISKYSILATVFLERVFDVLMMVIFLLFAFYFSKVDMPDFNFSVGIFLLIISAIAISGFLAYKFIPKSLESKILDRLGRVKAGLHSLSSPELMLKVSVITVIQWLIMAYVHYLCLISVGLHPPFAAACLIVGITSLALVLPTAPGYIGVIELGFIVGLAPFGVSSSDAVAAGIIYHLLYLVSLFLIAIPCWCLLYEKKA